MDSICLSNMMGGTGLGPSSGPTNVSWDYKGLWYHGPYFSTTVTLIDSIHSHAIESPLKTWMVIGGHS